MNNLPPFSVPNAQILEMDLVFLTQIPIDINGGIFFSVPFEREERENLLAIFHTLVMVQVGLGCPYH